MDRLTINTLNGYESINPVDLCLDEYSDINFERILDKLGAYEDAEEQGLILKLFCKVGDVIYQVNSDVDEYAISEISIREDKVLITAENLEEGLGFCFDANRIGKNYFLTREDAEQALAKMKEV